MMPVATRSLRSLRSCTRSVRTAIGSLLLLLMLAPAAGCETKAPVVELFLQHPAGGRTPTVSAEVAATEGERSLGLMYRRELGETNGMLFLFPSESPRQFWMKNTYVELDIIYLDRSFTVVSIVKKATPLTESPRASEKPAQYVLELRGGTADRWGIVPGSKAIVTGKLPAPR